MRLLALAVTVAAMTVEMAAMTMAYCMEFVEWTIRIANLLRRKTRRLPVSPVRLYRPTDVSALDLADHDIVDRWKHVGDGRDQDIL